MWRRKHFPAFPVTSTIETPGVVLSRGFQESLTGIPLSDKSEINTFLTDLSKGSISSSALPLFRKDIQYFPKGTIYSFIQQKFTKPQLLAKHSSTSWGYNEYFNILEGTLWNRVSSVSCYPSNLHCAPYVWVYYAAGLEGPPLILIQTLSPQSFPDHKQNFLFNKLVALSLYQLSVNRLLLLITFTSLMMPRTVSCTHRCSRSICWMNNHWNIWRIILIKNTNWVSTVPKRMKKEMNLKEILPQLELMTVYLIGICDYGRSKSSQVSTHQVL